MTHLKTLYKQEEIMYIKSRWKEIKQAKIYKNKTNKTEIRNQK